MSAAAKSKLLQKGMGIFVLLTLLICVVWYSGCTNKPLLAQGFIALLLRDKLLFPVDILSKLINIIGKVFPTLLKLLKVIPSIVPVTLSMVPVLRPIPCAVQTGSILTLWTLKCSGLKLTFKPPPSGELVKSSPITVSSNTTPVSTGGSMDSKRTICAWVEAARENIRVGPSSLLSNSQNENLEFCTVVSFFDGLSGRC